MNDQIIERELEIAYEQMSHDYAREIAALEWAEALIGDADEEVEMRLLQQALSKAANVKLTRELREKIFSTTPRSGKK